MKDYIEQKDKINGVQYAAYKDKVGRADGTVDRMTDARMAEIASNRFGHPVTEIQIRKLRTDMFGQVYREKREKKPKLQMDLNPVSMYNELLDLKGRVDGQLSFLTKLRQRLDRMEENVHNITLYIKQLDEEWSTCRPPGYKPGLPEIVNDISGDRK